MTHCHVTGCHARLGSGGTVFSLQKRYRRQLSVRCVWRPRDAIEHGAAMTKASPSWPAPSIPMGIAVSLVVWRVQRPISRLCRERFSPIMRCAGEHLVGGAHVVQRQEGAYSRGRPPTVKQLRNAVQPFRCHLSVEEYILSARQVAQV